MASILDLQQKVSTLYAKVPKQHQHHSEELNIALNNMVYEYTRLEELLTVAEDEVSKLSESYEALKWEFDSLTKEHDKLNRKLNSGLVTK